MNVELFTFASRNMENIERGVEAKLWAVATVTPAAMKSRITKSQKYLREGSRGVLYCNPLHSFTVPFVVRSKADAHRVVTNVWPEAWVLPFRIEPLGDLSKRVHKDKAAMTWPFLHRRMFEGNYSSVSAAMNITGTTVFVPIEISEADWDIILDDLATM